MPSTHRTFVVALRDQGGPATVQEVRTGRTARVRSLRDIAAQIERWLREARAPRRGKGETE
jgi:hypothetical protein